MSQLMFLVGLLCLGLALADHHLHCGPLQRMKVKQQWSQVYGVSDNRLAFATKIWRHFFQNHKDEVGRFDRVHGSNIYSAEFRGHMMRVFAGLDLLISVLDDEAVLQAALQHYSQFHSKLAISADIVKEFGKSLGSVLPDHVHGYIDVDAWRACFYVIAKGVVQDDVSKENDITEEESPEEKPAEEDKSDLENEIVPADSPAEVDISDQMVVDEPATE